MPRLSQWMIRAALVWLGLGSTIGGLVLSTKGVHWLPRLWLLRSAHVHMLLVGWTMQLACGVAFWILPRLDARGSRGDERLVLVCALLLNGGVGAATAHDLALLGGAQVPWLLLVAGVLYAGAALAFAWHAWARVVPFRHLPRPER